MSSAAVFSGRAHSASSIVFAAVEGSHVLTIDGYSRSKGLGNGKFIKSETFDVGGHRWFIRYYPDGHGPENSDWISIYLSSDSSDSTEVKARLGFSLLDHAGEPVPSFSIHGGLFDTFSEKNRCFGFVKFVERKALEASSCLKDDILRVKCEVTVKKAIRTEATPPFVVVPPSNMHQQFGRLLQNGAGVDVRFQVAGQIFAAHRCVLAARSPVFMAQLFGPMEEKTRNCIRMEDMDARVFKAVLHFIYTDTMADMDKEDDALVITQHLLVSADRYDLERLKLMCEDKLCGCIDASTVADVLALAVQHGCHGLKKACFSFLNSPCNLKAALASGGFDHLMSTFPSVVKELLAKLAPCP